MKGKICSKGRLLRKIWMIWICFSSSGGILQSPHLLSPGEFAIGIEPEVLIYTRNDTLRADLGVQLKYTHGLNNYCDGTLIAGTGNGLRKMRFGGNIKFEVLSDLEYWFGIGTVMQGLYLRRLETHSFEASLTPYLHRPQLYQDHLIHPFLAFPLGIHFIEDSYQFQYGLSVGCAFLHNEHFRTYLELGINWKANVSLSGGFVYYR